MEEAYREGKVRAIGVSNFYPDRYLDLVHFSEVKPMVNQVETHVLQSGVVVIPKSTHRERMEENFNVLDFSLSDEDICLKR